MSIIPTVSVSPKKGAFRPLFAALSVAFWITVWYLLALWLDKPLLLPTPLAVIQRIGELACHGDFWLRGALSLCRILGGILAGAVFAVLIGSLTATFPVCHALMSPLITIIKSTPVSSFIILALLWIDRDILPVFISFLIVFPVMWSNIHTGFRSVPRAYLELAQVFRLSGFKKVQRIYIPFTLPYFLSACRSSLGLAWKAGIAAEVLALPAISIGKQLYESKVYLETTDLFAWTTVVVLLSLLLEQCAEWIFRRLLRRRGHRTASPPGKSPGTQGGMPHAAV